MDHPVAWIDAVDMITVNFKDRPIDQRGEIDPYIQQETTNEQWSVTIKPKDASHIQLHLTEPLPLGETLNLVWGDLNIPVYPGAIVRTAWFEKHYTDTTVTLGADYTDSATTFTLWAPTAVDVTLILNEEKITLDRQARGFWSTHVTGDLHGATYMYDVTVNGTTSRVNDPYAKALLANSTKGVVINLSITDPADFLQTRPAIVNDLKDSVIYELHVRDATIQPESGATHRGKYLGLTEDTTTPAGNSSGITYIKELGVTHVQLLPINDFARVDELDPDAQYNWGYDPLFFQVPEGSYATDPTDPVVRIKEAKTMIQSFHDNDLAVILDVVYNHVFVMEESTFDIIVPGYYFRFHPDGTPSNGTGVGNDFASERVMGRKFILDTIDFWLTEYRIDGFRFDLMGIMDIETVRAIQDRALAADKPIMLLGEGWNLPTALDPEQRATMQNSRKLPGMRFFNDRFRDTVKGSSFQQCSQGFTNGQGRHNARLPLLITGSALAEFGQPVFADMDQTINFVEVHDNLTLWDQLICSNPDQDDAERRKMHQLATGFMLLSQGIPFIHAGQEWFRTKGGDENSYISGDDVNQLDWTARDRESENIAFVKSLITLRKQYDVFRLESKEAIRRRIHILKTPHDIFAWTLLAHRKDLIIYINPTPKTHDLRLPSHGRWEVAVTNLQREPLLVGESLTLEPYELLVMLKDR